MNVRGRIGMCRLCFLVFQVIFEFWPTEGERCEGMFLSLLVKLLQLKDDLATIPFPCFLV